MRIHPPEGATLPPEPDLLPKKREKLRHTVQSEGYETMTQHSVDTASEVKHYKIYHKTFFILTLVDCTFTLFAAVLSGTSTDVCTA